MYYHFAILLLFRPVISLRIIGSSISPRDICLQAAQALHGLLRSYAQLYTLHWTPVFVPHLVLTSSITHLAIGVMTAQPNVAGPGAALLAEMSEAMKQGIDGLAEMAPHHRFAEEAVDVLRYLVRKWNLDVDIGAGPVMEPEEYDRYVQPHARTLYLVSSGKVADVMFSSDAGQETTGSRESRQVALIESLLLQPVPLQLPPVLLSQDDMVEVSSLSF